MSNSCFPQAHLTHVYDTTEERKTGNNLLELMKEEVKHVNSMGFKVIGIAGDAGGDERKARRCLKELFKYLLIADCWGHQVSS